MLYFDSFICNIDYIHGTIVNLYPLIGVINVEIHIVNTKIISLFTFYTFYDSIVNAKFAVLICFCDILLTIPFLYVDAIV